MSEELEQKIVEKLGQLTRDGVLTWYRESGNPTVTSYNGIVYRSWTNIATFKEAVFELKITAGVEGAVEFKLYIERKKDRFAITECDLEVLSYEIEVQLSKRNNKRKAVLEGLIDLLGNTEEGVKQ